jgi:hypothetical protein
MRGSPGFRARIREVPALPIGMEKPARKAQPEAKGECRRGRAVPKKFSVARKPGKRVQLRFNHDIGQQTEKRVPRNRSP